MISRAYIKNYQSHKETVLDFHEGVNVIIGASDAGKSALIKALNWCINNKPSGDAFRSEWGGDTEVILTLEQGKKLPEQIHRIKKGTAINEYKYDTNDGKKIQMFTSFNQGVPDEIQKAFNLSELNFQFQIDRPFLLSNTSGEVARYFNKMANLDEIDKSVTNANTFKRKAEKKLLQLESEEADYKVDLEKYKDLDSIAKELETLEITYNEYAKVEKDIESLEVLVDDIKATEKELKQYSFIVDIDKPIDSLLLLIDQIEEDETAIEKLESMIERIEDLEEQKKDCSKILQYQKEIDSLDIKAKFIEDETERIYELNDLIESIKSLESDIEDAKEQYTTCSNQYDKAFPNMCPLCEQEIVNG